MHQAVNFSRRNFVQLGGVATLGATAASIYSPAVAQAGELIEGAPVIPSFFTAPDPIAEADIAETYDYDLVIVGAGNSGIAAAAAAVKTGVKVAVVEKWNTTNGQGNEGSGIDLDESDEAAVQHLVNMHLKGNSWRPRRDVVETWAHRSGEALQVVSRKLV